MQALKQKIKDWICNRVFVRKYVLDSLETYFQTRKEQLYRKSFEDALSDLKETQKIDIEKRAKELSEETLASLLSPVDFSKVLKEDKQKGLIYLGSEKATDIQLNNLKAEAEFLLQSQIWKLLNETPKNLAQESLFITSETMVDLQKGKTMLYLLSVQNNVINTLRKYTPKG